MDQPNQPNQANQLVLQTFSGGPGEKVLENWIKTYCMTPMGPNKTEAQLQYAAGQRDFVLGIVARIHHAQKEVQT